MARVCHPTLRVLLFGALLAFMGASLRGTGTGIGCEASGGDLFTSTANIQGLFTLEKSAASLLDQYIASTERALAGLREVAASLRATEVPASDTTLRPSDGFGVINRLVATLDTINKSINSKERQELLSLMDENATRRPTQGDLAGSAQGLLRLQRVYEQTPEDLLPEGTAAELLLVGQTAYKQGDFVSARQWLEVALQRHNSTAAVKATMAPADPEAVLVAILDYLAYTAFKLGDLEGAIEASRRLLTVQPTHARVADNLRTYEYKLRHNKAGNATPSDAFFELDNELNHNEREMRNFRKLCQGMKLASPSPDADCRLETYGLPHLLLKPVRVEHILTGRQELMVFRRFASPAECSHIRDVAADKLARAVAWTEGKFQPVTFRISTAAWIKPNSDGVVARIHQRMADATQLNLKHAEDLQVSNYGLGGHYEPHYDHHGSKKEIPKEGDRLATFMMYLSNVQGGGYTAFPRLKVAVAPELGDAVFWKNLSPGGVGDDLTLHGGCPVLIGSKHVANKWIHEKGNMCRLLPSRRKAMEKKLRLR